MRSHDLQRHTEATEASWEAVRGASYGAVKWGIATAMLGGLGYALSPIYRGLTIQFKVMLEADSRIREYEASMRMRRRIMREQAMWQSFEERYGKEDDDP